MAALCPVSDSWDKYEVFSSESIEIFAEILMFVASKTESREF